MLDLARLRTPSPRIVTAMPHQEGRGLAWNYIERVVKDLSLSVECQGGVAYIAHPKLLSGMDSSRDTVTRVNRMFYRISLKDTCRNAWWLREVGATHMYFAEHTAFDWRFALYRALAGVRITVHYHHGGGRAEPYSRAARILRRLRRSFRFIVADQAICVSQFIRDRVVTVAMMPAARTVAVLNAVVPEHALSPDERRSTRTAVRTELGIDDVTVIIVCGARAALEKGIDTLFIAFDALCASLLSAGFTSLPLLLYAGDGPDFALLQTLQRSLAYGERITMLGRRPSVLPLLAAAEIAVLPAVYDEAFGLFVIEAMQQHLPVIVTDRGGLPESVVDGVTGFVIRHNDSAMLADRLESLVINPELRAAMGERGATDTRDRNSFAKMLVDLEHYILAGG